MTLFRKRVPGSMFKRLFSMMTAGVLFCIFVAGVSMLLFFVSFWRNDRLNRLSDNALSLARSVSLLYEDSDAPSFSALPYSALELFSRMEDASLFITDERGRVILCGENVGIYGEIASVGMPCPLHDGFVFPPEILENAMAAENDVFVTQLALDPGEGEGPVQVFLAVVPVRARGAARGTVIALQTVSDAYLPYTTEFVRMLTVTSLLAVFTAFIISVIVSYRMVKPLKTITAAVKKYASADFSERISARETYSELSDLVEAFNGMAENLEQIDASRSAFVANISHELKTPMTIISGFIDGILDGTIPAEQEEKYLRIVSDETKRLSRLVVAMLNLSRIEAGKLTPVLTEVSLSGILYDTLIGFEMEIEKRHIAVRGLDSMEELTVQADDALFRQVVYNLVENAVKFTPEAGEIRFSLYAEKKNAFLKIRNTGNGIPQEELKLIFDRFYKVDKSRGLDAKSFGLGLYIVRGIVELHGGSISADSVRDAYTEFTVRLPL